MMKALANKSANRISVVSSLLLVVAFAFLLLVGCGPNEQVKEKWESFHSHFGSADSKYRLSSEQVRRIWAKYSNSGYGGDEMLAAVRGTDLSLWIKVSTEASKEASEAETDFSYLYANSKDIPASMKDAFYRFKEIVDGNARFIRNCQEGRFSTDSAMQWAGDLSKFESVYQSINLETKKVYTKYNWFWVDVEGLRH